MSELKIRAVSTLALGLLVCGLCALFPPRITAGGTPISRGFLLGAANYELRQAGDSRPRGTLTAPVELNAGQLLGECVLLLSLSGIIALYFLREHLIEADSR